MVRGRGQCGVPAGVGAGAGGAAVLHVQARPPVNDEDSLPLPVLRGRR